VLSSGLRLALLPALLLVGAGVSYMLPPLRRDLGRLVTAVTLLVGLGLALSLVPAVSGTATVERSFGDPVPGVELLLRGDAPGLVIVIGGLAAALFALGEGRRRPLEEAAILLCAAGTTVAGLAGNGVLLFGGVEIANLGSLLLLASGRGRVSRGALAAFGLQHVFSLGLLLAAVDLVAVAGTSDPRALPPGVVGVAIGLPWALAGVVRLLALGLAPGAGDVRASRAWAAISAAPCGAAILLRLVEAGGGSLSAGITVPLGILGASTALWGGFLAWRWQRDPRLAGRGLLLAGTGPVIALAGLAGGSGGFAAGLVALELALMAAPAWSHSATFRRSGRVVAAIALASAGGMPVGFGTAAIVLELGAVTALGPAEIGLLIALGLAAALGAAASLAAAGHALSDPGGEDRGVRPDVVMALGLGGLAALLPGAAGAMVLAPLAGSGAPAVVDALSLRGPGGSWPGGYLTIALLVIVTAIGCAAVLTGQRLPSPAAPADASVPMRPWPHLLGPRRRLSPLIRGLPAVLGAVDRWLIPQPQLGFAVFAAAIAIFILR
jgi:hypothetical protein